LALSTLGGIETLEFDIIEIPFHETRYTAGDA
jgi:hypothetical protein